jgi:cell division septation protein DedD
MTIRDADRFKDKIEVSLDSRQIFLLFFGGAVVACLVFVLGVMVGRRLEGRDRVAARAATSTAVDPLAALDELGADERADPRGEELAFPAALAGGQGDRARPLGRADVPPTPRGGPEVARPDGARPEPARPAAAPAPAIPTPPPAVSADAPHKPGTRFTLQISSFQSRTEADALLARLSAAGYRPYIVVSEVDDRGTFYRVRIGEYEGKTEARAAKKEFEKKQHLIAYVTRM